MKEISQEDVDPSELEIDPINERLSNTGPEAEDGSSLEDSIQELGVVQPVVARESNGKYRVVAGQRRTLAAQSVGIDTIPVRVMEMSDAEARMVTVTENAEPLSKDVTAEDRAKIIKDMIEIDGLSKSEIADQIGVSQPTIYNWLEPARNYWENTDFDPDSNGETGPDELSNNILKIIRKNTENSDLGERLAKKTIEENVPKRLVKEASDASANENEFEKELLDIIRDLNSDKKRIQEKVYFSGAPAEAIDSIAKEYGASNRQVIKKLTCRSLAEEEYIQE